MATTLEQDTAVEVEVSHPYLVTLTREGAEPVFSQHRTDRAARLYLDDAQNADPRPHTAAIYRVTGSGVFRLRESFGFCPFCGLEATGDTSEYVALQGCSGCTR